MTSTAALLSAAQQLTTLGIPWFDDNPLGWQELAPPKGSKRSAWDLLTVSLTNPQSQPISYFVSDAGEVLPRDTNITLPPITEATWYAEVQGKLDLKLDLKQVPGKNNPVLTVINLNADEVTTVLYFLTPQDLLNFYILIPNQVMAVTIQDLLSAQQELNGNPAQGISAGAGPQFRADLRDVPICELTYPSLQLAGRRMFVLKTMEFVNPPRNGLPPSARLVWVPQELFDAVNSAIRTAKPAVQGQVKQPGSDQQASAATAVSPALDPTQNGPALPA